jgi:hypothetical protein
VSRNEGESGYSNVERRGQHGQRRHTTELVIRSDAWLHGNGDHRLTHAHTRTMASSRHTVNSTPWANGNSPEKLTVFVARRM